ncbi:aspartate-alanine antiporter-like transporter [Halobacterium hubeiense]|uniref:aspartate-alanine antiporter-like transporter n=1 Tax=Halobacterium hubeiense TaxID=1407499 RepID=UPI000B7F9E67|nr:hypothetical protein [Halobacterium hubeiense]
MAPIIESLLGSGRFVLFIVVLAGIVFGQLEYKGIKFGVAGPLFIGLIAGHFGLTVPHDYYVLTLALFVATVGLIASDDIGEVVRTYGAQFIGLALVMCLTAAGLTYLSVNVIFAGASQPLILGSFSGALTSSPGLAAGVNSLSGEAAELFQIGHSVGYATGVFIIVLFQQLYPKIAGLDIEKEHDQFLENLGRTGTPDRDDLEAAGFSLIGLMLALVVGAILGYIPIPLGPFGAPDLGITGGTLIAALVLGYLGQIGPVNMRMDQDILSAIRKLTLAMFIAVVGIEAGAGFVEVVSTYGIQTIGAAAINSIGAIIIGFIITRKIWQLDWISSAGAITGGHTDTKGLAAAIDATETEDVAAGYGNTYPFALLFMVILTKILVQVVYLGG